MRCSLSHLDNFLSPDNARSDWIFIKFDPAVIPMGERITKIKLNGNIRYYCRDQYLKKNTPALRPLGLLFIYTLAMPRYQKIELNSTGN